MAKTEFRTTGRPRQPLARILLPIAARVVQRHSAALLHAEIGEHTVLLRVPYKDGSLDERILQVLDHCCNGDLVRALVRPLPGGGGDFRQLELISLDIDFAGISANPEATGPLLWNPADGIDGDPTGGTDDGKTEARTAETGEQA